MRTITKILKQDWIYLLISIAILGYIIPVSVPVDITHSGVLIIYISYIILPILFIYYVLYWFKRKNSMSKVVNILTMIYATMCVWYLFITLIRFFTHMQFYKSIQTAAVSLLPLAILLLIISKTIDLTKTIKTAILSMFILNLISTLYHVFVIKSLRSDFLVNINAVVIIAIVNLAFGFFSLFYSNEFKLSRLLYAFTVFNIVYDLLVVLVSGSRSGFVLGVVALIISLCIGFTKSKKIILGYGISLLITAILGIAIIRSNIYYAGDMFNRATTFNTLSGSYTSLNNNEDITLEEASQEISTIVNEIETSNTQDVQASQEQILVYNDLSRFLLWKTAFNEIMKSPIIGTGIVGFSVSSEFYPNQSAHNFVLEYALVFGVVGLVLWIAFIVVLLVNAFLLIRNKKIRPFIWLFFMILLVCSYSFLQPTLSMGAVTTITWLFIGILWTNCNQELEEYEVEI